MCIRDRCSKAALAADKCEWSMSPALSARIVLHPVMSCLSRSPCVHLHSSSSPYLHSSNFSSCRWLPRRSSRRRRDGGRPGR
eukprot:2140525-Pleurochrysis_carterae.AAC.1